MEWLDGKRSPPPPFLPLPGGGRRLSLHSSRTPVGLVGVLPNRSCTKVLRAGERVGAEPRPEILGDFDLDGFGRDADGIGDAGEAFEGTGHGRSVDERFRAQGVEHLSPDRVEGRVASADQGFGKADQQGRVRYRAVVGLGIDQKLQVTVFAVVLQALTEPRRMAGGSVEAAVEHRHLRGDELQLCERDLADLPVKIPARARRRILLVRDGLIGARFRRHQAQRP